MSAQPNTPLRFKHIAPLAKAIQQAITGDIELERMDGEYINIKTWFKAKNDGLLYQVEVPNYSASNLTTCVKTGANTGLSCTPSTNTVAGGDDYADLNAFACPRVNATIDDNGVPHVYAIEGDGFFSATSNTNGDVWVMTPVLYWSITQTNDSQIITISDTHHDGLDPQPGALYPDGTERPFMLYAAYAGVVGSNGELASISGRPLFNRTYSHNTSHTLAKARGAGYSGKTRTDDWYAKVMMMMKYATKSSQVAMMGCCNLGNQALVTVAETNVTHVTIATSSDTNFLVGSSVMIGTAAYDSSIAQDLKITSKEISGSNTILYLDTETPFTTTTSLLVSHAPYQSGYCDNVLGNDGSPVSYTTGYEPFKLQNIEMMVGAYEILSDVIMNATTDSDGNPIEEVYICPDCTLYSESAITSDYIDTGLSLPVGTSSADWWATDFANSNGLLIPQGYTASATTGMGDTVYNNVRESKGLREWLGVGGLYYGACDGLFRVSGYTDLTYPWWYYAGRLSATGRSLL